MEKKVKLVIRDDDANYFTNPSDLIKVYKEIPDFPISFAVVPSIVEAGACPDVPHTGESHFIGENRELCDFLKNHYKEGKCDILMHGITHEYKYVKGKKISEMLWRSKEYGKELRVQLSEAKKALEQSLDITINCFVAPHNDIDRCGIASLPAGMDYSGIVSIAFNRSFNGKDIKNYLIRCWYRLLYGFPYPGVFDYGTHKELNACTVISFSYLQKVYSFCKRNGLPMAINVHYWHIRDYPEKYKDFFKFIHYAIEDGAIPSRMRDCY